MCMVSQTARSRFCPDYSLPHVGRINERDTLMSQVCQGVLGSDAPFCCRFHVYCSAGILRVADRYRAHTDSNMHCSYLLDDYSGILAHLLYADGKL